MLIYFTGFLVKLQKERQERKLKEEEEKKERERLEEEERKEKEKKEEEEKKRAEEQQKEKAKQDVESMMRQMHEGMPGISGDPDNIAELTVVSVCFHFESFITSSKEILICRQRFSSIIICSHTNC